MEGQIDLLDKARTQDWRGLVDVDLGPPMGRGVFTTKSFKHNDIVIDYHGIEVPLGRSITFESYCEEDPTKRNRNYIIEVSISHFIQCFFMSKYVDSIILCILDFAQFKMFLATSQ